MRRLGRSRALLIAAIIVLLLTLAMFVFTEIARAPRGDGALPARPVGAVLTAAVRGRLGVVC